jgi:hypothetical protein
VGRNYLPSRRRKRLRARSPRQAAVSTLAYVHDSGRNVDLGPSSAVPTLNASDRVVGGPGNRTIERAPIYLRCRLPDGNKNNKCANCVLSYPQSWPAGSPRYPFVMGSIPVETDALLGRASPVIRAPGTSCPERRIGYGMALPGAWKPRPGTWLCLVAKEPLLVPGTKRGLPPGVDRGSIERMELALEKRVLGTSGVGGLCPWARVHGDDYHRSTTMDRDDAIALVRTAVDLGVTFFTQPRSMARSRTNSSNPSTVLPLSYHLSRTGSANPNANPNRIGSFWDAATANDDFASSSSVAGLHFLTRLTAAP